MQVKSSLKHAPDNHVGTLIKDKLGTAPEVINELIATWEDFDDWQYADLTGLKKTFVSDIAKVNGFLGVIKSLM